MKRNALLALLFIGFLSCAPEQSDEVRRREDSVREFDRLKKAEGLYLGVLNLTSGGSIPASVDIVVNQNPTEAGDKPVLSVSFRTGLMGGVTIASTSASFDWGTSQVSAAFARAGKPGTGSAQGALELKGRIEDGKWMEGRLIGAHFGQGALVLDRKGKDLFDTASEKRFRVEWETSEGDEKLDTTLIVKRRNAAEESPSTSDLPYLPGLDVSVVFAPFAKTPQVAKKAIYDPLTGTFDLQFTEASWIRLVVNEKEMAGTLTLGGNPLTQMRLEPLTQATPIAVLPPATYLGLYQGSPGAKKYKTIAYVDSQGSAGSNHPDLAFPSYPQLRLEVTMCNGDDVFKTNVYRIDVLDYLNRKALFRRGEADQNPLEIHFDKGWSFLDGVYLGSQEGTGVDRPWVKLRPNAAVAGKGCAAN